MHILRQLATVILPVALFIPGITNAAVVMPALDIALFPGDGGAFLSGTPDNPDFNIDATAFVIVTDNIGTSIDIPNQAFTLHGTFDGTFFVGSFEVAGGLLTGTFTDLLVTRTSATSPFSFEANLTYLTGSLKGGLTGGRLEGIGDTVNLGAKLGPVVVPVPAAAWLFGSGLIGLIGIARRKA